jgi:hypothetical protein
MLEVIAVPDDKPRVAGGETEDSPQLPRPPFPAAPGKHVVFWAAEPDEGTPRQFEDILMRRIPAPIAHRFRGAAGARGFTHAQYLTALVGLHEAMRQRADGGDAEAAALLDQFGLRTVSI